MNIKHFFLALVIGLMVNSSLAMAKTQTQKRNTENFSNLIANENFNGSYIEFTVHQNLSNYSITIAGPNDFSFSDSAEATIPSIELSAFGVITDGLYTYQLTAAIPNQFTVSANQTLNNGRGDKERMKLNKVIKQSGHFYIESGQIKNFGAKTVSVE